HDEITVGDYHVLVAHRTNPDGPGNLNASRCLERQSPWPESAGLAMSRSRIRTTGWAVARRMAGRESGNDRDLLDKHFAESSALGTTESRLGNNPMVIAVPRR